MHLVGLSRHSSSVRRKTDHEYRIGARLLVLTILSLIALTISYGQSNVRTRQLGTTPNPLVQEMIGRVSKDSAMVHIRALERFGTRYEFSPQRDSASSYITGVLNRFGLANASDRYFINKVQFADLKMVDDSTGWAVGRNVRDLTNQVFRTSDSGQTWSPRSAPPGSNLAAIDFVNPTTGWIVGSGGSIYQTTDAGSTWLTRPSGSNAMLLDVSFSDEQSGIAVGEGGTILRTADGGAHWSAVVGLGTAAFRKCVFMNSRLAWIVGDGGAILQSKDAGRTWTRKYSDGVFDLGAIDFADTLHGWAVGTRGAMLRTSDGGETWSSTALPSYASRSENANDVDIAAFSTEVILVLTAGEFWITPDGGGDWIKLSNLGTRRIKKTGFLSAATFGNLGGIQRSTDAGATWQVWLAGFRDDVFAPSRNCVATFPGMITPEREYVLLAHYDGPSGGVPGADNNASGVGAALEAMRILKDYKFASTIKIVLTSAKELGLLGSLHHANTAKAEGKDIRFVANVDMIGTPVTDDSSRLAVGSFHTRSPFVDSVMAFNDIYGTRAHIQNFVFGAGENDAYSFAFCDFDALHFSEGTPAEILAGNPDFLKPSDTSDKLNQGLIQRALALLVATIAELAGPITLPQKAWTWRDPFDRWNDLRSLSVVDSNLAFASGDYGTLIRTTNGGLKWNQIPLALSVSLRAVSFIDSDKGVVAGEQGTILMTSDGGKTWSGKSQDSQVTFNDVCLVDRNFGVAVGTNAALYQTEDGGLTWSQKFATPLITLHAVTFVNRNLGILVASGGSLFRTTDGGARWSRRVSGLEAVDGPSLFDVCMINASQGIAVGEFGVMIRTSDGGSSWFHQPSFTAVHLRSVHFGDPQHGFVVGDGGLIAATTDGGSTWSIQSNGTATVLAAVRFASASRGFAAGSAAALLRTTDGGATWSSESGGLKVPLYGVRFTDALRGIVVGYQGGIFRSIDGGGTWESRTSGTKEKLRGIDFPDPSTGIVVGDNGTILRTTDGGISWTDVTFRTASATFVFNSVSFGTPTTGIIVGRLERKWGDLTRTFSCILRSTDGGSRWTWVRTPWTNELLSVSFGGNNTVHAVGTDGLFVCSLDGGKTWFEQWNPAGVTMKGVCFAGPDIGVAVGESGTVVRTSDGGATWKLIAAVTNANLNSVWSSNGVNFSAVGMGGTVIVSDDAGKRWSQQFIETARDLFSVQFTDVDRGTVVGDLGTVMRTALAFSPPTGVEDESDPEIPALFSLSQNYPNPFNGTTTIEFTVGRTGHVVLKLYDLRGKEVAALADEVRTQGTYRVRWDAGNLPSGVYFYRLSVAPSSRGDLMPADGRNGRAGEFVQTRKMIFLK